MGFKFRKSINFGGFKINFSKSGIGYSYGVKGLRVTKTANGRTRTTVSFPGTGISYVSEASKKNKNKINHMHQTVEENDLLYAIDNAESMVSDDKEAFIHCIRTYFTTKTVLKLALMLTFCAIIACAFLGNDITDAKGYGILILVLVWFSLVIGYIVYSIRGRVQAKYEFETNEYLDKFNKAMKCILSNNELLKVNAIYSSYYKKNGGANNSIKGEKIKLKKKKPSYLSTNIKGYYLKCKKPKEKYYVMPDMIIIEKRRKINVVDLKDLNVLVTDKHLITANPSKDSRIIGYTYTYVNKDGGPDNRFSNNPKLTIAQVGQLDIQSPQGFNIKLQLSNIEQAREFASIANEMISGFQNGSLINSDL